MTRLPTLTAKKVLQALKRGGFIESYQKGSHLYLVHLMNGHLTCVPMHPGDLERGLLKEIIQQAGLAEDEFRKLL